MRGQKNPKDRRVDSNKGQYNGLCNRSACLKPGATWYNRATHAYYCAKCAKDINHWNRDCEHFPQPNSGPLCVER